MLGKRILTLILWLTLVGPIAFAQSSLENPKHKLGTRSSVVGLEELSIPMTGKNNSVPSGYKNYTDRDLDEFNRNMKEQEWGREETAWLKACDLNNSKAYEKYLAMYPYGAHAPEASVRLIEVKVNETLASAHSSLPDIKRVEEDDDSPETTIIIENNTGLTLTVLCSGVDYRSVVILPDRKASVKVMNGEYKIAASVPPAYIKPFAGQTYFQGGVYEIGFWVVTR
ncbi:MAG: hypothetical protein Q4G10_01115 [Bacteroidia bacterium]|nr:hypothetical protein [Bacteroidia bacterium]